MTTIPMKEVAAFLLGEAPLDGFWFGERHPAGGFWWREHLRAALAAPATAPAWHDAPTAPGTWILSLDSGMEVQENITQHEIDIEATWPGGRWFGPIPEDKP